MARLPGRLISHLIGCGDVKAALVPAGLQYGVNLLHSVPVQNMVDGQRSLNPVREANMGLEPGTSIRYLWNPGSRTTSYRRVARSGLVVGRLNDLAKSSPASSKAILLPKSYHNTDNTSERPAVAAHHTTLQPARSL